MKKLIAALTGSLFLGACSHAYIAQESDGQITACCPTEKLACTDGNLRDLAAKECSGSLMKVGSGVRESGSVSVQRNLFNGDVMGVKNDKEMCSVYKCDLSGPAPASTH
jgi:hypothetical protein